MSTHDPDPLTGTDSALLREVLAAAAGPASPAELAGEHAALAAFRAARPVPAPAATRRKPVMKPKLAALLTVKAAAAALVATSMGGVALAATTGNIPSPLPGSASSSEERAADRTAREAERATAAAARDAEKAADAAAREVEKAAQDGDKAADKAAREAAKVAEADGFRGLCTAFLAHPANGNGKWADSTAFTRLRTAASAEIARDADAADVTTYCQAMLAAPAAEGSGKAGDATRGKSGDATRGKSGDATHGKSGDATHGKSGDATHGKSGDAVHGKSATAPHNGQGDERSSAGSENGQAGQPHGNAGENGSGAENGEAGEPHGNAGAPKAAKAAR